MPKPRFPPVLMKFMDFCEAVGGQVGEKYTRGPFWFVPCTFPEPKDLTIGVRNKDGEKMLSVWHGRIPFPARFESLEIREFREEGGSMMNLRASEDLEFAISLPVKEIKLAADETGRKLELYVG